MTKKSIELPLEKDYFLKDTVLDKNGDVLAVEMDPRDAMFPSRWRKQWDGKQLEYSKKTAIDGNEGIDLAVQSEKEPSDINVLMRQYGVVRNVPQPVSWPVGMFDEVVDFQTALNQINAGREEFQKQPSDIRARFDNDPQKLWKFLHEEDPKKRERNLEEAREMGLLAPPAPPERVIKVEVTNPIVPPVDKAP